MYKNWSFFSSTIELIEMVLSKTDIEITREYTHALVPRHLQSIGKDIESRLRLTEKNILLITEQKSLLSANPELKKILSSRNPYIAPINLIQIELLKRLRSRPNDENVKSALLTTINGISTGMRNTG